MGNNKALHALSYTSPKIRRCMACEAHPQGLTAQSTVVLSWPDAGRGGDQLGNGDLMANRNRMRAHGCMSYLAVRLRRPKGGLPPLCRETAMSLDFRLSGKVSLRSTVCCGWCLPPSEILVDSRDKNEIGKAAVS